MEANAAKAKKKPHRYSETKRVDVHAHQIPPDYLSALHSKGIFLIGGIPIPEWSPELALEFMEDYGISFQMLSMSDPAVTFVSGQEAVDLARYCNARAAQVMKKHPSRFGAFGVLPMPDVQASIAEAEYALDTLKHHGVGLMSSYGGKYLGDEEFEPLLAELNRRRAWVFVHPTSVSENDKPTLPVPGFVYEYPFDTTRAVISLLFSASFKKYPRIRWHFAHGGGVVSMLRFRLQVLADQAHEVAPLLGMPEAAQGLVMKDATDALRNAHYDTALIPDPPELRAINSMGNKNRFHFGSDWPFAGRAYENPGDPQPKLSKVFGNKDRRKIDRYNAVAQFPTLKKLGLGK
jgi:predicted TIM-barrel fold metal-dependent hydrolase